MAGDTPVRRRALDVSEYRTLAESSADAIVAANSQNRIVFVNASAAKLFGRPPAELIEQPVGVVVPARLRAAEEEAFSRMLSSGEPIGTTLEVAVLHASGHEFPIEITLGSIGEGADRIITGIIRDLSPRRRRERRLAAQLAVTEVLAERRSAVETPGLIVAALTRALEWDCGMLWMTEPEGALRLASAWQADATATDALVGTLPERVPVADAGVVAAALEDITPLWLDDLPGLPPSFPLAGAAALGLRAGVSLPLVVGGRARGVYVGLTREALSGDEELRGLLLAVGSQIGQHLEQVETQERLVEARARFARAFERAPIGMALIDTDERCLDVNPALCRLIGVSREQLVGARFAPYADPVDETPARERFAAMVRGDIDDFQTEVRYVPAGGGEGWALVAVSIVRQPAGSYCIVHVVDVTAARQAADLREHHATELERSNRELEHFAHVAAHDLRGPLRTVTGLAQVLGRRHAASLDEDGRELLGMIIANAQRGGRLLENLLTYAHAGARVPLEDGLDPGQVVAEVLAGLRAEIDGRDARVTVDPLPAVCANRVSLSQILQNLIANAIKFTPPERRPTVHVAGAPDGAMVRLSVTDNGPGLAPGEVEAVFEMFGRGARAEDVEGTGIGLAVCARLVARHGGRMWVEPAPDGGSTFHLTLPASSKR